MRRFALAAFLAVAALAARAADPYATTGTYVYTAVDEVTVQGGTIRITGMLSGDPAPTTLVYVQSSSSSYAEPMGDRCHRYALLAMSKPGQYVFKITTSGYSFQSCSLARATP